jgi:hypothetical protein
MKVLRQLGGALIFALAGCSTTPSNDGGVSIVLVPPDPDAVVAVSPTRWGELDFGAVAFGTNATTQIRIGGPAAELSADYIPVAAGTGFSLGTVVFDFEDDESRYEIRFDPNGLGRFTGLFRLLSARLLERDGKFPPSGEANCEQATSPGGADTSVEPPLLLACFDLSGEGVMPAAAP